MNLAHAIIGTFAGGYALLRSGTKVHSDPVYGQDDVVVAIAHITTGYCVVDVMMVVMARCRGLRNYAIFHVIVFFAYCLYLMNGTGCAGVAVGTSGELCVIGIHMSRLLVRNGFQRADPKSMLIHDGVVFFGTVVCKLYSMGMVTQACAEEVFIRGVTADYVLTLQAALLVLAMFINFRNCVRQLEDLEADYNHYKRKETWRKAHPESSKLQ